MLVFIKQRISDLPTPFEKMKADSKSGALDEHIRHQMLKEQKKTSQGRVDLFIQKSLKSVGRGQLAKRLEECSRGQYCGNIYCRTCRVRMAAKMNKRYQTHIQKQNMVKNACRERLRFITILHRLIPADKHQVAKAQKYVRQEYRNFSTKWGCWYQGAFEYELLDMLKVSYFVADAGFQSRKKEVSQRLGRDKPNLFKEHDWSWIDDAGEKRTDYILLHTHFLMDGGNHDWNDISANIRRRWSGDHIVNVSTLWDLSKRPLADSLWKIASYPFKNRCQYHYDFGNYEWEKDEDDYDDINAFTASELLTIFDIYKHMMGTRNTGHLLGANNTP